MTTSLPSKVYLVLLDEETEQAHAENLRWEILGIFYKKEDAIEYAHNYALDHYDFDSSEGNIDEDDDYDDYFWFNGEGYLIEDEESNLQNDIRLHITVKEILWCLKIDSHASRSPKEVFKSSILNF